METLIPAPTPRQAKNIPEKQQPPPPPFLICSYIWSTMLGANRGREEMELGGLHGAWAKERSQKKGLMETGSELRNKAAGGFWKEWAKRHVLRGQQRVVKAGARELGREDPGMRMREDRHW